MIVNILLSRDVIIDCVLWSYFSAVFLVKHKQTHMRFALKKMNKQLMLHRNQVQCYLYGTPSLLMINDAFDEEKVFSEEMVFSEKWREDRQVQADTGLWRSISSC